MNNPSLKINNLFYTNDLKTGDELYEKKKKAIEDLKKVFTSDLNSKSRMSEGAFKEDFWKRRRYYMQSVHLKPEHLTYALENKKAFIKWFLTKFPTYNVTYDPRKRNLWTNLSIKGKKIDINPYYVARQRDLLFGANGVEAITADNWREKIRQAQTKQEVEDIKILLDSEWEIDNFVSTVETLINVINDDFWELNWWINETKKPPKKDNDRKKFEHYLSPSSFGEALKGVQRHFYDQQFKKTFSKQESSKAWGAVEEGSINSIIQFQQEAGMDFCHFVVYDLMKEELERVSDKALYKAQECEIAHLFKFKPSRLRDGKSWLTPDSVVWSPTSPSEQNLVKPSSINPELGQEKELPGKPVVSKQNQEQQIKDKLTEISDKLKNKAQNSPLNKKETKDKLTDVETELIRLEKSSDGSNGSKQAINDLTKQIEGLREQLKEIKKSLKEILENAKDYTQKLFSWFKDKSIEKITLQDNGEKILVKYNSGQTETLSQEEVSKNKTLTQFKEYSQQSQQKTLTFSELSQISDTSPLSSTNQKHWDKYRKYYIGTGIVLALVSVGAVIYHFWIKKKH